MLERIRQHYQQPPRGDLGGLGAPFDGGRIRRHGNPGVGSGLVPVEVETASVVRAQKGSGAEIARRKVKEGLPANPTWENLIDFGPPITPVAGRPDIALLNANEFRLGIGNLGWQAIADYSLRQGNNVHVAFADTLRPDKPFLNSDDRVERNPQEGRSNFDVVGISVPFEDTYVNALKMMDEIGLPLRSQDRLDDDASPLVVAGGMAMINPMPLAPFMDIMILKEGREAFNEITTRYRQLRDQGVSKRAALEEFADIEGVFIPSLYDIEIDAGGYLTRFEPRELTNGKRAPEEIKARETLDMIDHPLYSIWTSKYATYEQEEYVSVMAAMGCDKKCSFCLVGSMQGDNDGRAMKTDLGTILDLVDQRREEHRDKGRPDPVVKIFFSSAFSAGAGGVKAESIKDLLRALQERGLQGRVGSLNIQQADEELFQLVSAVGQDEVTFAPETTEGARAILGKAYSKDEKLREVAQWCGKYKLDLNVYSLGSLPGETDQDTLEYAQFLLELRGLMGPDQQMAVHYNPMFVKAQTDNEVLGNTRPEEARRKLELLQETLGDSEQTGIRIVSVIEDPMVYYQPLLSVGDFQSAALLENLHLTHGTLQSELTEADWGTAVTATGIDDSRYFADRDPDRTLSWEPFVFSKVTHARHKQSGISRRDKALARGRRALEEVPLGPVDLVLHPFQHRAGDVVVLQEGVSADLG